MTRIMKTCWNENQHLLRAHLAGRRDLNTIEYTELVKTTLNYIYNCSDQVDLYRRLDLEHLTEVDDGDYQGTRLFIVPFRGYQPSESDYIITFVNYGSCSGCDTLLNIQEWHREGEAATERQLNDFMVLCKDIVCNAVKPFNYGWREDAGWLPAEEDGAYEP